MTVNEIAEKMNAGQSEDKLQPLKSKISAVLAMEENRPDNKKRIVRKHNAQGYLAYKAKEKAA